MTAGNNDHVADRFVELFDIKIFDKNFEQVGYVVDPVYMHLVPAWDSQGYGSVEVRSDNPYYKELTTPGNRIQVYYKGEYLLAGPLSSWRGTVGAANSVTVQFHDDSIIFHETIAVPNPWEAVYYDSWEPAALNLLGQAWVDTETNMSLETGTDKNHSGYVAWVDTRANGKYVRVASAVRARPYWTNRIDWTGQRAWKSPTFDTDGVNTVTFNLPKTPAGIMVQQFIGNCMHRLRLPIKIGYLSPHNPLPGDMAAWPETLQLPRPKVRNVPVWETFTPWRLRTGLTPRLRHYGDDKFLTFEIVERGKWDLKLDAESGIVVDGRWATISPTITRAIAGGPGSVAGRAYGGDLLPYPLNEAEQRWGFVRENFTDAQGADLHWPDGLEQKFQVAKYFPLRRTDGYRTAFRKAFSVAATESREAGSELSTVLVQLAETEAFSFGGEHGIQLGDDVVVNMAGQDFNDYVSSAMLTLTRDKGLVVTPVVGGYEDDPDLDLQLRVANLGGNLSRYIATR